MILGVGGQVTLEAEVRDGVLEEVTLRWDQTARTELAPGRSGYSGQPQKAALGSHNIRVSMMTRRS